MQRHYSAIRSQWVDQSIHSNFFQTHQDKGKYGLLIILVSLQVAMIGAAVWEITWTLQKEHMVTEHLLFDILITTNLLFSIAYLIRGFVFEKLYDLCLCAFTSTLISTMTILRFIFLTKNTEYSFYLFELVASVCCLPLVAILFLLASNSLAQFNIIGASFSIIRMYRRLCCTLALIKFELQINLNLVTFTFFKSNEQSYWVIASLFLFVFVQYFCANKGLSAEMCGILHAYISMSCIFTIWTQNELSSFTCDGSTCTRYLLLCLVIFCILFSISIILRIFISIHLLICYKNFGYGLTDRAFVRLASNECTSLLGGNGRTRLMNF